MKKSISAMLLATLSLACFANNEISYSYAQTDAIYRWGRKGAQTYNVAIAISEPELEGKKIASIYVPVFDLPTHSDYSIWLSKELTVENLDGKRQNVPDLLSIPVERKPLEEEVGYIEYTFPEEIAIPQGGLYVGYTFTVNEVKDENDDNPMLVGDGTKAGGCWVYADKSLRKWKEYGEEWQMASLIKVNLTGDFGQDAAVVSYTPHIYAKSGENTLSELKIANRGCEPVKSVTVELEGAGTKLSQELVLDSEIVPIYNREKQIYLELPPMEVGSYNYSVRISKVNGNDNYCYDSVAGGTLDVLERFPVKRTIMEEFTDLSCQYCPRGMVGMEKMAELHKDFIGIAYHYKDDMAMPSNLQPQLVEALPGAWLDRTLQTDPYLGLSGEPFGIEETWQMMQTTFSPVEITVDCDWIDDNILNVTSTAEWVIKPEEEGDYRIEYVLLADELANDGWIQLNGYGSMDPEYWGDYMASYCQGGENSGMTLNKLVFNDVAVDNSGCFGIEGSIESTDIGHINTHSYNFDISLNKIVQDKTKLRVVAMVLLNDKNYGKGYGKIINGNVCKVSGYSSVNDIERENASTEIDVKWFDLSGREVVSPCHGLYIRRATFADGRVINSKVML